MKPIPGFSFDPVSGGFLMKKFIVCAVVLLMATPVFAAKDEHETDRVKEAGAVLKEILNVPDDIPQDLLNKAECVVMLPSVK